MSVHGPKGFQPSYTFPEPTQSVDPSKAKKTSWESGSVDAWGNPIKSHNEEQYEAAGIPPASAEQQEQTKINLKNMGLGGVGEPTTTIPSYQSRHDQTPPKGGMNTGATTDLSGGRPATQEPGPGDSFRDEYQYTIPKHRSEDYGLPDAPPSYQDTNREYIKYKGNQSGLSDDEARYAMLTGSGQSSYGDDDDDAAKRYALLTGKSDPGQTQLDRYTSRYTR